MHQTCTYGSLRGARGNSRPYRDRADSAKGPKTRVDKIATLLPLDPQLQTSARRSGQLSALCQPETLMDDATAE